MEPTTATALAIAPSPVAEAFRQFVYNLQDEICAALEALDGKATFREDAWQRDGGGGGRTRVIAEGAVWNKGGVNVSTVYGELPAQMQQAFKVQQGWFYATGVSLVIHPENPFVPTTHANYRYFELYDQPGGRLTDSWFGGGADLTPYYLFEDDARHFHAAQKSACDTLAPKAYVRFKTECDRYFLNTHRGETRGIGGIFYDYLRPGHEFELEALMAFAKAAGKAFLPAYLPIAERRKDTPYTEANIEWQEIRRGRYVEFNLLHDRGTKFGIASNGRTESILMSLPSRARWAYDHHPAPNTPEAELVEVLRNPRAWLEEE